MLVTGGSGFIGAALIARLVELGCTVWAISRSNSDKGRLSKFKNLINTIPCDINHVSQEALSNLCPKVDIVFHLAAAGVHQPALDVELLRVTNVEGTKRLLQASKDNGIKRFIHVGSCFEYRGGLNLNENSSLSSQSPYALTKSEASKAVVCAAKNFPEGTVVLRLFMVYGPGESESRLIPYIISRAFKGEAINLTEGEQVRDFVFIDDVIDLLLRTTFAKNISGRVFNVCSGRGWKIKDVVAKAVELTGSKSELNYGALPYRENEAKCIVGNPERTARELGWVTSVDLEEGLAIVSRHIKGA